MFLSTMILANKCFSQIECIQTDLERGLLIEFPATNKCRNTLGLDVQLDFIFFFSLKLLVRKRKWAKITFIAASIFQHWMTHKIQLNPGSNFQLYVDVACWQFWRDGILCMSFGTNSCENFLTQFSKIRLFGLSRPCKSDNLGQHGNSQLVKC